MAFADKTRIYERKRTPGGAVFYRLKDGTTQYDLTNSKNLLRDMNRAILSDTDGKKSGSSNGAIGWFTNAIENDLMVLPESHELTNAIFRNKSRSLNKGSALFTDFPGRMYTFLYRAKNMGNPYDRTPLIISLPRTKKMEENNLIFGMNLHYIDPELRQFFVERLLKISSRRFGEKPPPRGAGFFYIDYDLIKTIRFVFGMPCIRTYSLDRVIGKPIMIPSNEWGNAVALPYDNFVLTTNKRIWLESRIKLRKFIRSIQSME